MAAGLTLALLAAGLMGGLATVVYRGWLVTRGPAADLAELLRPHLRTFVPEGPGPFPTAILVPGCVGAAPHLEAWGRHVAAQGWAAVAVDSLTPRGWNRPEFLARICTGRMFWGTARAGDVLVALDEVRRLPFVDAERLVLGGWSHGAWAIMDLLAFDPPRRLPFNLTDLPPGFAARRFEGVVGLVLFYPYCGVGNRARRQGWRHRAETLMILAEGDTIVSNEAAQAVARHLRADGHPITVHIFPGVNHGFDDEFQYPGSPLVHDPVTTAQAMRLVAGFLDRLRGSHR